MDTRYTVKTRRFRRRFARVKSSRPQSLQLGAPSVGVVGRDPRAAMAAGEDEAADWSRICEVACERGKLAEAAMAFHNAADEHRDALRERLCAKFGDAALELLPAPPFAGLSTPWRDAFLYPFRAGGGYGIAAGTVFFLFTARLLGPVGIALGFVALLSYHPTVLRASLRGEEDPPYPAEFPTLAFSAFILPAAIFVSFAPILIGYGMMFGVSGADSGRIIFMISRLVAIVVIGGFVISAPCVLIAIAWEKYHSFDALHPAIFAAGLARRPWEGVLVLSSYIVAIASAIFMLALSVKCNIAIAIVATAAAQWLLSAAARRIALFDRC